MTSSIRRSGDIGLRNIGRGPGVASVIGTGAVAAAVGAAVMYAYGAAAAALSVPMRAGDPWAAGAEAVTPANFALGALVCTFWGTVLAALLGRFAAEPSRTFVRTALVLVAASLAVPAAAVDTAAPTRLTLALAHVTAGLVVVPALARSLRRSPSGR